MYQRSRFREFESDLKTFVLSSDKTNSKIVSMKNQLTEVANLLTDEISLEEQQLGKSVSELNSMRSALTISEVKYRETFENLIKYIDDQKDLLVTQVEGSLIKRYKEITDNLLHQVDTAKNDLSEFAEKQIPYLIKQSAKQWFDQSLPFIDQGCNVITKKAVEGFAKYFSKKPMLNSLTKISTGESNLVYTDIKVEQNSNFDEISKKSMAIGAAALGLLAFVTTGGILPALYGVIGGSGLGQKLIGSSYAKKELERQKHELNQKIPVSVEQFYMSIHKGINGRLNNYFEKLKEGLGHEFNNIVEAIKLDIDKKIADYDKNQSSSVGQLQKLEQYKQKIINTIN